MGAPGPTLGQSGAKLREPCPDRPLVAQPYGFGACRQTTLVGFQLRRPPAHLVADLLTVKLILTGVNNRFSQN